MKAVMIIRFVEIKIVLLFLLVSVVSFGQKSFKPQDIQVAIWCMNPSNELRDAYLLTDSVKRSDLSLFVENAEILAVTTDSKNAQAYRVTIKKGEYDIWAKNMADGSKVIALFNLSENDREINVKVEDLGMAGTLRDLWKQKDIKEMTWDGGVLVKQHGAAICKVIPFSLYSDSLREDIPGPDYTPEEVCRSFSKNLISRKITGELHYAEVCTAVGAFRAAWLLNDLEMYLGLMKRYQDFYGSSSQYHNYSEHVDISMRGSLPLEIYLVSNDKRFLDYGLTYADRQWNDPVDDGLSKQTRWWIDDMYMISILQVQAYRASGDVKYITRAAHTLIEYCERLQRSNGLFYHGPDFPQFWGRGNGWVAVGMAEVLKSLPESHELQPILLKCYKRMMDALVKDQDGSGMWKQLIDNVNSWDESSCTAMFGYALTIGVNYGFLTDKMYEDAMSKAWDGLTRYINPDGTVREVCMGTGQHKDARYYLDRPRIIGDYHGQAPVLWFAAELMEYMKENKHSKIFFQQCGGYSR
ncbi:glycoside hydrolase family 88 protein [Mangrovibacterium marinum]|uniref:glycoside hydrolase family 88 protein n=1 Tax=Mangrovibacterium marinum TaxID=1639118 RepID=UPI002A18A373|nr:glycoside hydrolase family 88 protein [Mangrovibacterium marinum]